MYCPTCGIDNSPGRKYCASCGTNLEVVSQALSGNAGGFFTKVDTSLDQFIARYAEHVFKDAPVNVLDQRISRSWQILGQGVITSLVDLVLFNLMFVILPFRFLLLLISTPIGLLSERSRRQKNVTGELEGKQSLSLPDPSPAELPPGFVPSITEHTTRNLHDQNRAR